MPSGININSITPDFRDFLLGRNLLVSDSIANSGYASYAYGLGFPADIGNMNALIDSDSLETIAFGERTIDVVQNTYVSDNPNYQVVIETSPVTNVMNEEYSNSTSSEVIKNQLSIISEQTLNTLRGRNYYIDADPQQVIIDYGTPNFTKQVDNYLDTAGKLNLDGPSTNVLDIASGLLSGQSPLISSDGTLSSTNDVRSGLLGRTLVGTGIIEDTPLGNIANVELSRQLINNLGRNAVQETAGKINLNVTDLIRGGSIYVPNYKITNTTESTIADVTGFNLGRGLDKDLFFGGGPIGNIDRANNILTKTGQGQKDLLLSNLRLNRFRAGLTGMEPGPFGYVYMEEGNVSAAILDSGFTKRGFGDESELSVSEPINDKYLNDELFENVEELKILTQDTFSWDGDTDGIIDTTFIGRLNTSPDSILDKTKRLFDSGFINTLDSREFRPDTKSEIQTGIKNGEISKGSAVLGADGKFCRVWTKKNTYSTVADLQKNEGMRLGDSVQKTQSVLDDNGFVKMSPISGDNSKIKRYMFSIENLAWGEDTSLFDTLLPCEVGANNGRVMWFPPYDLSFTDNTNAKWDSHEFIGRPEPMYTYNSSERTGNLSFKIIVDNPSAINSIRENYFTEELNNTVDSYFAGCIDEIPDEVIGILSVSEQEALKVAMAAEPTTKAIDPVAPYEPFSVYFLNDVHVYEQFYEDGSGTAYNSGNAYIPSTLNGGDGSSNSDIDKNPSNRNVPFNNILADDDLKNYIKKYGKSAKVEIYGYASKQGTSDRNQILSDKRVASIETMFREEYGNEFTLFKLEGKGAQGSNPEQTGISYTTNMKDARRVDVKISVDPSLDENKNKADEPAVINTKDIEQAKNKIAKRMFTECSYFSKLEQTDEFAGAVEKIYEKIKYFTPAFHSMTPEGFNSRLTFLLQCTKAGETTATDGPDNLAFGKPPVCVLRIGDFYHTKIIIDTVNYSFDPLLWDLNPEGIGVQPMVVDVDLSFKFIGGSSLGGPINDLQNAVAFNFFANTEVYDGRSKRRMPDGTIDNFTLDELLEADTSTLDQRIEIEKNRVLELEAEEKANAEPKNETGTISPDDIIITSIVRELLTDSDSINIGERLSVTFADKDGRDINFANTTEKLNFKLKINTGNQTDQLDLGVVTFTSGANKTYTYNKFEILYSTISKTDIDLAYLVGGTARKKI